MRVPGRSRRGAAGLRRAARVASSASSSRGRIRRRPDRARSRSIDMRYRRQVHEVNVPSAGITPAGRLDADSARRAARGLREPYRERTARARPSAAPASSSSTFRVRGAGRVPKPRASRVFTDRADTDPMRRSSRRGRVFLPDRGSLEQVPAYDFERLAYRHTRSGARADLVADHHRGGRLRAARRRSTRTATSSSEGGAMAAIDRAGTSTRSRSRSSATSSTQVDRGGHLALENVSGSPDHRGGPRHDGLALPRGRRADGRRRRLPAPSDSSAAQAVKHVVGTYSDDPGINEGDVYMLNDSYTAALHPPDVYIISPVYYEGELRGFVANFVHVNDIGAVDAGGFSPNSRNSLPRGLRPRAEDRRARQAATRRDRHHPQPGARARAVRARPQAPSSPPTTWRSSG